MTVYTCERCLKEFKNKGNYMNHMKRKIPCQDSKTKIESMVESAVENKVENIIIDKKLISKNEEIKDVQMAEQEMYKFLLGDCVEELKKLKDKTIDIVVTSPPYNIGLKYHKYQDKKPRDQYLEWIYDIFVELKRVLKDDGHIFLNMGYTNKDPWIAMEVAIKLKELFVLQNNITWVKSISISDKSEDSHGHFKPINSKRYINVTNESIFHFTKKDTVEINRKAVGVPYKWKCNMKNRKTGETTKEDKRCKGNSWFIPYQTVQSKKEKGYHPATFPEGLVEHCIKLSDVKTGCILDPFIGSGTTLRVAQKMTKENDVYSLSGVGIDIDETYINYCQQNIGHLDN